MTCYRPGEGSGNGGHTGSQESPEPLPASLEVGGWSASRLRMWSKEGLAGKTDCRQPDQMLGEAAEAG